MADQTPASIEREIEAERAALAETLDHLQQSLSPERIVARAEDFLRKQGGALFDQIRDKAGRNPIALAVTLAGLGWLVFGPDDRVLIDKAMPRSRARRPASPSQGFERRRSNAMRWLLSFHADPKESLRRACTRVSPEIAAMIDDLDEGLGDISPGYRARTRQDRLRTICGRMATQQQPIPPAAPMPVHP